MKVLALALAAAIIMVAGGVVSTDAAKKPRSADLNRDGVVNQADLDILIKHYGTKNRRADLNKDGKVNIFDLSILLSQIKETR